MHDYHTFETFTESLKFEMSSPLSTFFHQFHVVFKSAIFFFIEKGLKELLVLNHIFAGLFPHDEMGVFLSINLISKSPEETVPIPNNIPQLDLHRLDFLVEIRIVLKVDVGQFERIGFGHFLP